MLLWLLHAVAAVAVAAAAAAGVRMPTQGLNTVRFYDDPGGAVTLTPADAHTYGTVVVNQPSLNAGADTCCRCCRGAG